MTPTPQYVKDLTHGYSHIATSAFDLLFHEILDHHAPIRSIKVHGKQNPCITEETRELIKSRTYWRKIARRTNNPADWSTYKNLKQQLTKLIRAAESEFVKDQIQNNPRNTNCIWKEIRLCLPKRSVTPKVYSKDDKTVADDFNNFFPSVGKSTNSKIESLAEEHNFVLHKNAFTPKFFFLLVSNLHLIMLIVNKSRTS